MNSTQPYQQQAFNTTNGLTLGSAGLVKDPKFYCKEFKQYQQDFLDKNSKTAALSTAQVVFLSFVPPADLLSSKGSTTLGGGGGSPTTAAYSLPSKGRNPDDQCDMIVMLERIYHP